MLCWHVTSGEAARSILEGGFKGGWGDNGFGVYVFSDLAAAEAWLAKGGWDAGLVARNAAILEIDCPETELRGIDIHPDWPDPEAYHAVLMHPMCDEAEIWAPVRAILAQPEYPGPDDLSPDPCLP